MEYIDEETNSDKIWSIHLYDTDKCVTFWGRRGYDLQCKEFEKVGEKFFDKKIKEKTNKGYCLV